MQIKGVKLICKITSEASGFCSNQAKAHLIEIIKCVGDQVIHCQAGRYIWP